MSNSEVFLNIRLLAFPSPNKPISVCSIQDGPINFQKLVGKDTDTVLGLKYRATSLVDKLVTTLNSKDVVDTAPANVINATMLQNIVNDLIAGALVQDQVVATLNNNGDPVIQISFKAKE